MNAELVDGDLLEKNGQSNQWYYKYHSVQHIHTAHRLTPTCIKFGIIHFRRLNMSVENPVVVIGGAVVGAVAAAAIGEPVVAAVGLF